MSGDKVPLSNLMYITGLSLFYLGNCAKTEKVGFKQNIFDVYKNPGLRTRQEVTGIFLFIHSVFCYALSLLSVKFFETSASLSFGSILIA